MVLHIAGQHTNNQKWNGNIYIILTLTLFIILLLQDVCTESISEGSANSIVAHKCDQDICLVLNQTETNWRAAQIHCAGKNGTLLQDDVIARHKMVSELINIANLSDPLFLWIGGRYHLSKWMWPDGQMEPEIPLHGSKYCTTYDTRGDAIQPEYCQADASYYFICQGKKDVAVYGLPFDIHNHFQHGNTSYYMSTLSSQSWIQAQTMCKSYSMNLIYDKNNLPAVKEHFNLRKPFWIGATRWEWQWATSGTPVESALWKDRSNPDKSQRSDTCMGISTPSDEAQLYTWRHKNCGQNAPGFICQYKKTKGDGIHVIEDKTEGSEDECLSDETAAVITCDFTKTIITMTLVFGGILMVALTIEYVYLTRRQRYSYRQAPTQTRDVNYNRS